MTCDSFRTRFHVGTDDAALLAHLRTCDRCLDFAAHSDPDVMFRALGGEDMIPPGGVDAFVSGVMQQVRVRDAEQVASHREVTWPRRMAMAAAIGAAVFGTTMVYRIEPPAVEDGRSRPSVSARQAGLPVVHKALTTKPVVAAYDSEKATIVELPTDGPDEVKIVMVFDESLPADL
ncbi:MAG TPA: hypothetical protein VNI54_01435 [Thermoanaerobaculia bacterium]|nr:hypothetical protein [Thermoanaerobaculia bacterium]